MELELDQIVKGVKTVTSEEIKNSKTSLLSEIRFMMEQLQVELQQEVRALHKHVLDNNGNVCKADYCVTQIHELSIKVDKMENNTKEQREDVESKMDALGRKSKPEPCFQTLSTTSQPREST